MSKICTSCNSEIPDSAEFCTECGTKAAEEVTAPQTEYSEFPDETPVQEAVPPVTELPAAPVNTNDKVVGMGSFFGLQLLYGIPVVGLIASLIMSFAPKNRNIKNYARASLIWSVIGVTIAVLIYIAVNTIINTISGYIGSLFGGSLGGLLGNVSDIGQYVEVIEQFESGEFNEVIEQIQDGNYDKIRENFKGENFDELVDEFESGKYDELIDSVQNGNIDALLEQLQSGEYNELLDKLKDIDFSGLIEDKTE